MYSVCVSTDGSRRRNPPERCPRPLYPQDCPEENHNIPEDHQGEDLIDIKVEVIHGAQEAIAIWADQQDGSRRRNPPERCPRPLCPQDCPEENHNIPEDHQEEDPTKNKVKEETEEEVMTRGDQPCVSDGKEEIPGDVSTVGFLSLTETFIAEPSRICLPDEDKGPGPASRDAAARRLLPRLIQYLRPPPLGLMGPSGERLSPELQSSKRQSDENPGKSRMAPKL
ncbi:uncharacterized protein [Ranitomeya imitator]